MHKLMWLAGAGALGTLLRYALSGAMARVVTGGFPWGTLVVNLLGCFLFGLVLTLARERGLLAAGTAEVILVGFMGAFTTFSSFVNDVLAQSGAGRVGEALLNLAAQNLGGIACFIAGAAVARLG